MSIPAGTIAPKRIVILGATSAIAEAAARIWAKSGSPAFVLAGRNGERLESIAANLRTLGAKADTFVVDFDEADPSMVFPQMIAPLQKVDIVLLAYGSLGNQEICESDLGVAQLALRNNFTSPAVWCLAAAKVLEAQGHGVLAVIGSVAGDRGRASNYIYGAAKGGLGLLVQGVAHRLSKKGARAILIKPGFVNTPMTAHIPGRRGFLWSSPERVAKVIVAASNHAARTHVTVYAPSFWRVVMFVIRSVPARIFHKTNL